MSDAPKKWTEIVPSLLFALLPLVVLAALAGLQLFVNIPAAQRASERTTQSFSAILAIHAIDEAVQDAERGQRGFVITGRDAYLDPYVQAQTRLPQLMVDLQQATIAASDQQPLLLRLQADITTKMNELASVIEAMRTSGFDAAKGIVDTDAGRISMESIERDVAALTKESQDRLAARQARAEAAARTVAMTFIAGGVISAIAFVIGAILVGRAHERSLSSERLLQATLDSVREGVGAFDRAGRLRAWNSLFASMFGTIGTQLKSGAPLPLESPRAFELGGQIKELVDRSRRTGRPALVEWTDSGGTTYETFHSPTGEMGHVTSFLDISARLQTEQALHQAQKLDSIGQMTGGVAHDFNNLLAIMIGNLGLLRKRISQIPEAMERVDLMVIAAERGARLTGQLLAFARRQPLEPEIVNLGTAMQEILPLLRRAVGESIVVESVAGGGLWNVKVDASHFQSAVVNLALNSRDAMPDGGKLTIEVGNAALDDFYAARHAEVEPGQYVLFAITDTGRGMNKETMTRALDPFFTTKAPGEGTGLGLPQVYGFVKQSGGHLKIYSELGQGTTVKLYLPRTMAEETVEQSPPPLAVTGTETVLLVDDDDIVRATVGSMLEDLGYNVFMASSGEQALKLLADHGEIDLLFTDVVMPGPIGGRQLAEAATRQFPGLRILFTSGYTENAIVHNGTLDRGVELLSKPYDRQKLAAKLRRVLDGRMRLPDDAQRA